MTYTSTSDALPREVYNVKLANTTDTQLCKAAWMNSKNGTLRWKKLCITNNHAANAALVIFWDQDTASATPGSYGDNTAPLFVRKVSAISSVELSELQLPGQQFIAGIACKTDNSDVYISVEVEQEIV